MAALGEMEMHAVLLQRHVEWLASQADVLQPHTKGLLLQAAACLAQRQQQQPQQRQPLNPMRYAAACGPGHEEERQLEPFPLHLLVSGAGLGRMSSSNSGALRGPVATVGR